MKMLTVFSMLMFSNVSGVDESGILPTKLRITVIDGLGNFVEGATVAIYENEQDYRVSENAVAEKVTDARGRVTFKKLKTIHYYVEAKKEEQNNNGEGVKTGKLAEGKINIVNTVIE